MGKITKADLVDAIYKASKYEKQAVQSIVDAFIIELKSEMQKGNTIELRGFGTFEARFRKGRDKARNPKTGFFCSVPPHYVAVFRSGQDLKKTLLELEIPGNENQ